MEPEQIDDETNLYLKNYSQISTLLNLDADPSTFELETTIMQMKIVFTDKPVEVIVAKLYQLLQEKGTKVISPQIVSFLSESTDPILKHEIMRPLSRKQRLPYKTNKSSSYTYDSARVEQPSQPNIQKKSVVRSLTGDERLLPLFKQDEKFKYQQKHYKSEVWYGAISTHSFSKDELHRYQQKQLAAKALVYRGYGYPALKEQLIISNSQIIIQPDRYKVVSCSMIVQIYRKIEEYINTNFTQKYIPLTSTQIKPLHAILFNAFKEFPKIYSETLSKFIIITYNLTPDRLPQMSALEGMELYRFIQITLHQKILRQQSKPVSLTPQSKYSGQKIREQPISAQKKPYEFWTPHRQRLLIEGFHECRSLCKVRQKFKIHYPELHTVSWFDYNFLKNRLDKMLRQVIRKMQVKINQNGVQLKRKFEINDARIKEIAKSPNSLDVRLMLTEIYRDDSYNQNNIKEAMRLIVEFFDRKNTFDFSRF